MCVNQLGREFCDKLQNRIALLGKCLAPRRSSLGKLVVVHRIPCQVVDRRRSNRVWDREQRSAVRERRLLDGDVLTA